MLIKIWKERNKILEGIKTMCSKQNTWNKWPHIETLFVRAAITLTAKGLSAPCLAHSLAARSAVAHLNSKHALYPLPALQVIGMQW